MKRRSARVGACGLVLAWACKSEPREVELAQVEDEVIAVVCDQMFACDCPQGTFYADQAQCESTTRTLAQELRRVADMESLTWDPRCLGRTLATIDDADCGPAFDAGEPGECAPPCHYLHGDAGLGETCQLSRQYVTDCAQGLVCLGGTCADPCGDDPNDSRGDVGESCDSGCKDGLVCDGFDFVCRKPPTLGQNCDFGQCAEGLFCEPTDPADSTTPLVCKQPVAVGQACRGHAQCASGYCPAGFCDELPGEGESCRGTFVCARGLDCIEEVCVPGAAAVCEIRVPLPGL